MAPLGEDGDVVEELADFAEQVLGIAESIPPGQVLSYGDVAGYLGSGGPRQVGAVMSMWGSAVCWWRVVRADGSLPEHLYQRALPEYRAEGTPLRSDGRRVDVARARWTPAADGAPGAGESV